MAWIKRNLIFVISAAVGVALMGVAIFFLINSMGENQDSSDKIAQAVSELKTLQSKTPSPTEENIVAAKDEKEKMKAFINDFRKSFAPFPPPPHTDDKEFQAYLRGTILELQVAASNAAVQLPPNYAFSFSSQVEKLGFSSECIQPWMEQLQEIKTICTILYGAKINYLESLQRVPGCRDDGGGNDYLSVNSVTNQNGVTTPYKISFLGFSAEIAAVLDGFQRSSNCFIVKNISVTPAKVQPGSPMALAAAAAAPARNTVQVEMERRMNMTGRPAGAPATGAAGASAARPAAGSSPVPILWEKQLYVTMTVDVLKLKPAEH